jgi:hypothetical protein
VFRRNWYRLMTESDGGVWVGLEAITGVAEKRPQLQGTAGEKKITSNTKQLLVRGKRNPEAGLVGLFRSSVPSGAAEVRLRPSTPAPNPHLLLPPKNPCPDLLCRCSQFPSHLLLSLPPPPHVFLPIALYWCWTAVGWRSAWTNSYFRLCWWW